eukprot:CCRYP_000054-RA/>CCRYP_000054-RA protein AED:0.06 eAED:0.06 QI:5704/0.9/1/1/0.1/0.09/11/265/436
MNQQTRERWEFDGMWITLAIQYSSYVNTQQDRNQFPKEESIMFFNLGENFASLKTSSWDSLYSLIALGTLFYSFYNQWPLPQSFFYAVDAGMSIGFCTDVVEPNVTSRAFTVIYILLGASCVGGALVLMVQSILEQAAQRSLLRYKQILEKDSFKKAFFQRNRGGWWTYFSNGAESSSVEGRGVLSYREFRVSLEKNLGKALSEEEFYRVCQTYDPLQNGFVKYEDFKKTFKGNDKILSTLKFKDKPFLLQCFLRMWGAVAPIFTDENKRIYLIFITYICVGVTWGIMDQGWDVITATHFAVSALATGGLTAPPVDENGFLPAGPAIFCGLYCIFGIPLFALTLSQFASVLVENYIVEEELLAIKRPLTRSEFQFASQSLCSSDIGIHLSDFIVLQLFRQGKLSLESLEFMKRQFQLLDTNRSGRLNWDEAQKCLV